MAQDYVSVMDPAYSPPDDRRLATLGMLRGLLDVSPVGAGDLLHQIIDGQSRMTMPGVVGGLLGVPKTPPPGEALSSLLGIGGSGPAYETWRALTNAAPLSLLGATRFTTPSRGGSLLGNEAGAIFPEGKRRLIDAIENRGVDDQFVVGSLEPRALQATRNRRERLGMPPLRDPVVVVSDRDVQHMLKRVDKDGLTSSEIARLAEEVLSPGAIARVGDHGLVNLWGPRRIEFELRRPFQPLGILNDPRGSDLPHLFGVIPKGWAGRK
jgi:hypothetical protein